MASVVGIDFGTSNSAVSSLLDSKNQVIPDEKGRRLTPSIVSFGKNNKILIGLDAKTQGIKNPQRTIHSIKRLIGRKTYSSEIQKAKILLPYKIVEGDDQNILIEVDEKNYTPQEIGAFIIKRMKEIAEKGLKDQVNEAVITVPAYFNDAQRLATKETCQIAGLDVLRVINEPTAAALAYGFGKGLQETIAIYDLGGGTFDISILKLKDKVFEVVATAGDTFLGGDDFDDRIIDIIASDFLKKTEIDLRKIPAALPILRDNAEKTKRRLSYAERSDVYIPGIVQKEGKALDLHFSLSRDQLREQTMDLIQRTFAVVDEALNASGLKVKDLDATILVGGPTKMPLITEAAESYFGKIPLNDLNPDEVVSIGASIQAQSLKAQGSGKNRALLLDVTPLDLGIATVDGFIEPLIEKNTPIPTDATKTFTTTKDNQTRVDLRVYQGKNRRIEESTMLGEFQLSGFEPKAAGQAAVEVTFAINTDGIVEVTAVDQETGNSQNVTVKLSAAMGQAEVKKSSEKTKEFEQVELKYDLQDATKVLVCVPATNKGQASFQEGLVENFDPMSETMHLIVDEKSKQATDIGRDRIGWIASVEDFNNIPRYLKALTDKPKELPKDMGQILKITMNNDDEIFGIGEDTETGDGFWIKPFVEKETLEGKVFIFRSKIKDVTKAAG